MSASKNFFYAENLPEVFYQLKTISDLTIVSGCTSFVNKEMPPISLTVRDIPELKNIDKHERYIDIGSSVSLGDIERLGKTNLPATLYQAILTIANPNVRNIATIGGNVCARGNSSLSAVLLALDARLEFQNGTETLYENYTRFREIPKKYILTAIRFPLDEWEVSIFKRVGPQEFINDISACFVFLANSQKNQISDIKIAMAGTFKYRDKDLENKLIGAHLPLSETAISNFLLDAEESFEKALGKERVQPIIKKQFWNLLKYSLEELT
ncbi:MAG: FAD binding domain-containing protein [Treponema sp.]|nr:FAD binding domain-containing protein [Treponema sp.]